MATVQSPCVVADGERSPDEQKPGDRPHHRVRILAGKATSPAMRRGLAGFRRVRRRDRARLVAPSATPAFHLALSGPTHDVSAQHDNRLTRRMLSRRRGATAPGRAETVRRSSARVGAKPQHRSWLAILRERGRGWAPSVCEPAPGRSRRGDPWLPPQGVCPGRHGVTYRLVWYACSSR